MNETLATSHRYLSRLEIARLRQKLLALRDELADRPGPLDRIRHKQVHSAVCKLDQGNFGVCEACAKSIPKARLIEKPYVRYCIACF